jgi:hypothetical protein
VNQWLNPLKRETGSNLVDMGRVTARAELTQGEATPTFRYSSGRGGHGEGLRRTYDDAVGEELGTDPVDRYIVNVGTVPLPPSLPPSQGGSGQTHRWLTAWGWDGVFVVVRARESRVHGEGRQQARNSGNVMPGVRW